MELPMTILFFISKFEYIEMAIGQVLLLGYKVTWLVALKWRLPSVLHPDLLVSRSTNIRCDF